MRRRDERRQAFLLLFENSFHGYGLAEIIKIKKVFKDSNICEFAKVIFFGVNKHKDEIEKMICENSTFWKKDRLSRVALCLLKIAIFEMLYNNLPESIAINEAVDLAKEYGTDGDWSFVNGVLSTVGKMLKRDNANASCKG
ncbi:MAG: transcription antitermination factor NusB [Oscillospiraceae bacterium]|jgi:N utilization substance protein B|nr:transcription antitermination factor NusB [Oscillospiraceae bacterium]